MIACLVWFASGGDMSWLVFIDSSKVSAPAIAVFLKNGDLVTSEESWDNVVKEAAIDVFPISVTGKARVWIE